MEGEVLLGQLAETDDRARQVGDDEGDDRVDSAVDYRSQRIADALNGFFTWIKKKRLPAKLADLTRAWLVSFLSQIIVYSLASQCQT